MRYFLIINAIFAIFMSSCNDKSRIDERQTLMETSKQELANALQERDELLSLVKDITTNLNQIKHLENIVTFTESQSSENPAQRSQILSDISKMRKTLQKRREQLSEYESKLQESSKNAGDLNVIVNALRRQLDLQADEMDNLRFQLLNANERICVLNNEVDSLNMTVAEVCGNLDAVQAASIRLENEMNTCYYVIASKSQLKEHQILETGFLRKSKLLKGDFDKGFFVIGDKRNLTSLDLKSKKIKIRTSHPEDSYRIIETEKQKTLTIISPEKFWSLTNYLVIQSD